MTIPGTILPRILCLDIGTKRTGVAVCDETRTLASPRGLIQTESRAQLIEETLKLARKHEAGMILVGLPLNHHGEIGRDAENVHRFTAALRERTTLPVLEWDERLTTVEAERILVEANLTRKERKGVIDQLAATIILQSYIDSLKNSIP